MAKVIEFYVPARYKPKRKYVPLAEREAWGRVLQFRSQGMAVEDGPAPPRKGLVIRECGWV